MAKPTEWQLRTIVLILTAVAIWFFYITVYSDKLLKYTFIGLIGFLILRRLGLTR